MVIDTSALIAILLEEPTAERLSLAVHAAQTRRLSAASLVEAALVAENKLGDLGGTMLDRLVVHLEVEVLPFSQRHATFARAAFRRFGKGRHPAGLNFGDCFSYALARALHEPLLFVGDDFSQTDVGVAPF